MRHFRHSGTIPSWLLCLGSIFAQSPPASAPVVLTVVDENNVAVSEAQVVLVEPGLDDFHLSTDYAGHGRFTLQRTAPYSLHIQKPGFYQALINQSNPLLQQVRVELNHEQVVLQQVSVTASPPGIDTQQTSDKFTMNLPEIVNVPYPTSRDIRNLLSFYPGVTRDAAGQLHIDGSETWATLVTLDGFDIRSPVSGVLAMRVSADAIRSIDEVTTRYPVEFGRGTGGVVAFYTGMGDNKFRFNATDFFPSFQQINGIQFDKFVPRVTFSGPLVRDRAWFFDGLELEYDNNYIRELPQGADSNHLVRGSNLSKFQVNGSPANILSGGLLVNDYHSPYDGLSPLIPQQSTTKRNTVAWMPYLRDQRSFHDGALLDLGLGLVRFSDGYEPHGDIPFQITPELSLGSYFENLSSHSQRVEANAALYLPPRNWIGRHDLKAGIDLDHIGFGENVARTPIDYLREDGSLLRQSVFPVITPFTRHNIESGAYVQDRWALRTGILFEPGLRFDWDEIIRRPLASPRFAVVYSPAKSKAKTKVSAGIGLYYEHTQLEYLMRALAGMREDTYYADNGLTPTGPPSQTNFIASYRSLQQARALNWSVGAEQKIPGSIFLAANLIRKRVSDEFTYANQTSPTAVFGTYSLTNSRQDRDNLAEIEARRFFSGGYTLFAAYTRSSARTNAAIDYLPTLSMLGPEQAGPLPWDAPNRVLSWGWLPFPLPGFRRSWDFVYSLDWRTGFPFTAINANQQVVGAAGSDRFPDSFSFSPGLEWRFHFRGSYFGLRGVIENATNSENPVVVNNVVDSTQFGNFSQFEGRALTARIRLIGSKK